MTSLITRSFTSPFCYPTTTTLGGLVGGGGLPADFPLVFEGSTPVLDLDYARALFYVNGTTYRSLAAFIAAGGCAVGGTMATAGWYSAPFSFRFVGVAPGSYNAGGVNNAFSINNGTGQNAITLRYASANPGSELRVLTSNSAVASLVYTTDSLGAEYSAAAIVQQNNFQYSSRARDALADTSGNLPAVSQLAIGWNGLAAGNEWNGTFSRLTIWASALKTTEIQALSSGNIYGPTRRTMASTGGGIGGTVSPRALNIGDYTYLSGVSSGNGKMIAKVKNSTKQYVSLLTASTTPANPDDHDSCAMELINGGTQLLITWSGHNVENKVYWRVSSDLTLTNLAATQTLTLTAGHLPAYRILKVQASTGKIIILFRVNTNYWGAAVSTDTGATFTYLGQFFFNDIDAAGTRTYMNACWADASTIRIFCAPAQITANGRLRIMDINVDTNVMTSGSGTVGTFGTDTVNMSDLSMIWNPGSGISAYMKGTKEPLTFLGKTQINATGASDYYWCRCTNAAAPYTEANWTKTYITDGGDDLDDKWEGDACISGLTTSTPEVYIGKFIEAQSTWHINRWVAGDANGSTWTEGELIASGGNGTDSPVFRPASAENADPSFPVSWQAPGTYTDYNDNTMQQSW